MGGGRDMDSDGVCGAPRLDLKGRPDTQEARSGPAGARDALSNSPVERPFVRILAAETLF
jgi:hypothetical protein